jgi:hypothetical protein
MRDVTKGEAITVDIQLTDVTDDPANPQAVNVTLFGNGVTRSAEATKTDGNSYQANFSTDGLSTESYDVYTGVEIDGDVYGYNELIGLSDSTSVTIEDSETETETQTPESPTETDNAGGGSSAEDSETASQTSEKESTGTAQISPSSVTTQAETQRQTQTSELTAVETAPQTEPQPQSTPSNAESTSVTTSSEVRIFPSAGIIILCGTLIGILHRLRHSE